MQMGGWEMLRPAEDGKTGRREGWVSRGVFPLDPLVGLKMLKGRWWKSEEGWEWQVGCFLDPEPGCFLDLELGQEYEGCLPGDPVRE